MTNTNIYDIYDLYWTQVYYEDEHVIKMLAYCVCPDCHSIARYAPADPDCPWDTEESIYCHHCKRDNRKKDSLYNNWCPNCGWHGVERNMGTNRHPWRCNRCYAEFEDKDGTISEKNPRIPDTCPTCNEKSLQRYSGKFSEYYQCQNSLCEMLFFTNEYGKMEFPKVCPACKRNTLQDKRLQLRGRYRLQGTGTFYYNYIDDYIIGKQCTMCKKIFDRDTLQQLELFEEGYRVKEIIDDAEHDIFSEIQTLKVAPTIDNTLKYME